MSHFDDDDEFYDDDDAGGDPHHPELNFMVGDADRIAHRNIKKKTAATLGRKVAGLGISGAQTATGVSTVAVIQALATGGSVAGGPLTLAIAGGVMTVAGIGVNSRSAYKTHKHIHNLEGIHGAAWDFACSDARGPRHKYLIETVLPYIIAQKRKKRRRRIFGAIPAVNLLESLKAAGRKAWKKARGTLGKDRALHAHFLALHHQTSECELTVNIISELFGVDRMTALAARQIEIEELGNAISRKLKSR